MGGRIGSVPANPAALGRAAAPATETEPEDQAVRLAQLDALLASAPVGFAFFDRAHRFVRLNALLADINGLPAEAHLGRTLRELLPVNAEIVDPVIEGVFATGEPVRDLEIAGETPRAPGITRHWLTSFFPIVAATGETAPAFVGAVVIEITERKRTEEALRSALAETEALARQKEMLLKEMSHRIKNWLQLISSLINLQATAIADPALRRQFGDVSGRILSVGRIHQRLYESGDVRAVEFGGYLRDLAGDLEASLRREERGPLLSVEAAPAMLPVDKAVPLALIVTELVTNAFKYAYPEGREAGPVTVASALAADGGELVVSVADDGVGLPEGLRPETGASLGMQLVRALVLQLDGRLERLPKPEGTAFAVHVPLKT